MQKLREPTICAWRKHFSQLGSAGAKRLKALKIGSSELKKLRAVCDLRIEVPKDLRTEVP